MFLILISILLSMLFLHIVDDFYLQGLLATMKQKSWWKDQLGVPSYVEMLSNYSDPSKYVEYKKYRNDWKIALVEHAFSWAFSISFPMLLYMLITNSDSVLQVTVFLASLIVNAIIHAIVDNKKCNKLEINLIQDQLCHIVQIIVTWIIFVAVQI